MFRLMIVDDEPIAVDSLYEILVERNQPEFEIYKSYSSVKALEVIQLIKMDILLCDIQMPKMNGFQLSERVHARWPHCKIIFLTGYRDFSYAQTAIRHGGVDYVLKTEGDEAIFKAIEAAMEEILRERNDDQLSYKAKQKLHLALPSLRKDYLLGMLSGDADSIAERKSQFLSLDIQLDPTTEVFPVLGMVDLWRANISVSDKALFLYCIQNIADEHLSIQMRFTPIQLDHFRFLWLLQPSADLQGDALEDRLVWEDTFQFVNGTLESVQESCKQLLKLPVSLALPRSPCSWEKLAESYTSLKWLVSNRPNQEHEVILIGMDRVEAIDSSSDPRVKAEEIRLKLKKLDLLEYHFDNNHKLEFMNVLSDIMTIPKFISDNLKYKYLLLEVYYGISSFFLSFLNRYELTDEFDRRLGMDKLISWDTHVVWNDAIAFYDKAADFLFDGMEINRTNRTNEVIRKVNLYIEEHLSEELSLTKLVEIVHLNTSYLSRLYKQETGIGLLEYITEMRISKAKELLLQSSLKIHEISSAVGLISSTYFARIFRKATQMTPQEYRDHKSSKT